MNMAGVLAADVEEVGRSGNGVSSSIKACSMGYVKQNPVESTRIPFELAQARDTPTDVDRQGSTDRQQTFFSFSEGVVRPRW